MRPGEYGNLSNPAVIRVAFKPAATIVVVRVFVSDRDARFVYGPAIRPSDVDLQLPFIEAAECEINVPYMLALSEMKNVSTFTIRRRWIKRWGVG